MIFVIVQYTFILLEEVEDSSFSNLAGKFGFRLTCVISNVKLLITYFPTGIIFIPESLKNYCVCVNTFICIYF